MGLNAAQRRELSRRNINLEYQLRAVRRSIINEQAAAYVPPQPDAPVLFRSPFRRPQ